MNTRPATLKTDEAFCEKVCRIAVDQGWVGDAMHTSVGHSFAFVHPEHGRVSGSIQKDQQAALANACKQLLPHISNYL